jgi:hypothetical protein
MKDKPNQKMSERGAFRCTEKEMNRIIWLASQYAGGNLSRWMVYAALNVERKYLTLNDVKRK